MRAPAKPPQRERKGAGEERTGGREGGEGAGKAEQSLEGGGGATTMGARKKKKNTEAPRTQTPKSARRERNMTPRIGASRASGSTAQAPGLDRPGVNPEPRTGASEATPRIRQKEAPEWSCRGGMKHSINPRTGSSGGEPGATDWSVGGGGESTTKRPPGLEQPGRNEARRKPPD